MKCMRILPGDVGQHLVPVLQLHPEHRVRQRLDDRSFDLDAFFLRHASFASPGLHGARTLERISGVSPPHRDGVLEVRATAPVARHHRPAVAAASPRPADPTFTIGSIASTWPDRQLEALARRARSSGTCGSSCISRPMPWPTRSRTTAKPAASTWLCTAWRDVADRGCPSTRLRDARVQRLARDLEQPLRLVGRSRPPGTSAPSRRTTRRSSTPMSQPTMSPSRRTRRRPGCRARPRRSPTRRSSPG